MLNIFMSKKGYIAYSISLVGLCFLSICCIAFKFGQNDNFDLAKQEILLRKIGHELLLQAGDKTSRVLPIQKVTEEIYQIRFEHAFSFQPDSLVKIVNASLSKNKLARDYIVNVKSCDKPDVVFGYAIASNQKNDIQACSGRTQPKGCYYIEIQFQRNGMTAAEKGYLIGGIPLFAFVGLIVSGIRGRGKRNRGISSNAALQIGNTMFDVSKRVLMVGNNTVELTLKEAKLLLILASPANKIIERARLQKEIWEDEGVIVGRSLDMFISKLRKKLDQDDTIKLVNIHGKGYKLETYVARAIN